MLATALLAATLSVSSGPATVTVTADPWRLTATQRDGAELRERRGLGVRDAAGWHRALRARALRRDGDAVVADLELEHGRRLALRIAPAGDGVLALSASAPDGTRAVGTRWQLADGEVLLGSGERSDAVDRRGLATENYVADGPYPAEDRLYVAPLTPPWALRDRDDATYFPVPWLLSSRGWGVQVAQDETSRFDPAGEQAWSVDVDGSALELRLYSGPTPAKALARFTAATGRQRTPAAPWTFGPWFQTGQPNVVPVAEERAITRVQRAAGAPVSVAETQMHHLPCGAHESRRAEERERTDSFHRDGVARLVYFNPLLCLSYSKVFGPAASAGILQQLPGGLPFLYPAFVGGAAPLGFTSEPLAQFDFTHPRTEDFYAALVREAVALGADGWMEDFGESTPPLVVQHDGSTGDAAHNRYPTDYHCAMQRIARRFERPLVRHQRSGWTGAAACADVVWGGDPTTIWGFDGLRSVVTQLLSAGLSGISRWGTDIGGYDSFGAGFAALKPGDGEEQRLTPELLSRWIEVGALVPVMRTKRTGLALPSYARPQVYDAAQLPLWRKLTELHTQLNRYLQAADEEHRRSGLPIARHLALVHPELPQALNADLQYLLGPDLLVAPVVMPGARERRLYLPPGRWLDWWTATRFDERSGAYELAAPETIAGGRELTLPAPIGRPPLLLRAGAVLPLLSADIDTLTDYGSGLVHLSDRRRVLRLLALPRGATLSRLGDGASARSLELRRRWVLRIRGRTTTRYELEVALRTLRRPFVPRRVLRDGRPLARKRWRYERATGVLRLAVKARRARIEVRA